MRNEFRIINYAAKQGRSFFAHVNNPSSLDSFHCAAEFTQKNGKEVLSQATKATLGDAAFGIEARAEANQPWVEAEAEAIFGNLKSIERKANGDPLFSMRPKSVLSTESKLEKCLKKEAPGQVYEDFEHAASFVMDQNGVRIFVKSLDKLSEPEIMSMVKHMRIDGQKLTEAQRKLLLDYVYERPIKKFKRDEAFSLYEKFAQPLIEKRSKEVVDQMTVGIIKHRINNSEFTLEELEQSGLISDEIVARLKSGEVIEPMDITRITNYRGRYGLPEFSNNQIRQLSIALDFKKTGERVPIYSDPRGLDYRKYSDEELSHFYKESIKDTGYRSAQFNMNGINGAKVEGQIRGLESNKYFEADHLYYDSIEGKNTLGGECDDFVKAMSELSKRDKIGYEEYKHAWSNYYQRQELGLPAKKPRLNPKFNKLLSIENNYELYEKVQQAEKYAAQTFKPHYEAVA